MLSRSNERSKRDDRTLFDMIVAGGLLQAARSGKVGYIQESARSPGKGRTIVVEINNHDFEQLPDR